MLARTKGRPESELSSSVSRCGRGQAYALQIWRAFDIQLDQRLQAAKCDKRRLAPPESSICVISNVCQSNHIAQSRRGPQQLGD